MKAVLAVFVLNMFAGSALILLKIILSDRDSRSWNFKNTWTDGGLLGKAGTMLVVASPAPLIFAAFSAIMGVLYMLFLVMAYLENRCKNIK